MSFKEMNEILNEKTTLQEKFWDLLDLIDDLWFKIVPIHWIYRLPHNIFQDWPREVKWAWQRVFTGYDERVVWGPYNFLGEQILLHLKNFRDYDKHGYPMAIVESEDEDTPESFQMNSDKWDKILDDMVEGWEFMVHHDDVDDQILEQYGTPRDGDDAWFDKFPDMKKWNSKCTEEYAKLSEEKTKKAMLFVTYFHNLWD